MDGDMHLLPICLPSVGTTAVWQVSIHKHQYYCIANDKAKLFSSFGVDRASKRKGERLRHGILALSLLRPSRGLSQVE
jgi:hypothetical protein